MAAESKIVVYAEGTHSLKELHSLTLVVAFLIFGVGGGVSAYEGIRHLLHPRLLEDPT